VASREFKKAWPLRSTKQQVKRKSVKWQEKEDGKEGHNVDYIDMKERKNRTNSTCLLALSSAPSGGILHPSAGFWLGSAGFRHWTQCGGKTSQLLSFCSDSATTPHHLLCVTSWLSPPL
jgi:hypothetical protein